MKISQIQSSDIVDYLRLDDDADTSFIEKFVMPAAKQYIVDYTNLSEQEVENNPSLALSYMVLCQEYYDHREFTTSTRTYVNQCLESTLESHRRNFL